jgi:hypothetical protein
LSEAYYLSLLNLISGFSHRMTLGPLTEFEVLAYETACRLIQSASTAQRRAWDAQNEAHDAQREKDSHDETLA